MFIEPSEVVAFVELQTPEGGLLRHQPLSIPVHKVASVDHNLYLGLAHRHSPYTDKTAWPRHCRGDTCVFAHAFFGKCDLLSLFAIQLLDLIAHTVLDVIEVEQADIVRQAFSAVIVGITAQVVNLQGNASTPILLSSTATGAGVT